MAWNSNRANFNRNLAIVIGIDHYKNHPKIHDLSTPVSDAVAIADLLEADYDYAQTEKQPKVIRLFNEQATLGGIRTLLTETLPKDLNLTEGDRLIFYFAGHGLPRTNEDGPEGYLVPQDADPADPNSFLPMREVAEAFSKLACHHLLVILDCCFAGTFRWAGSRKFIPILETVNKEHYYRFIRYPTWQLITSAAHDQEALDVAKLSQDKRGVVAGYDNRPHSPFALALLEGLQHDETLQRRNADLIPDGVVTAHELFVYLEQRVSQLSHERQTPGLYPLRRDYDKGEFVFTPPKFDPETRLKPAPELNEENNPYRGLKPFDEKHAEFFFGRQVLIKALAKRLCQPNQTLQVVLGVSGSGKSSLVKAGLLPYLRTELPKTYEVELVSACIVSSAIVSSFQRILPKFLPINFVHQWQILDPMRPQVSPFMALARVLLPVVNPALMEQLMQVSFLDEKLKQALDKTGKETNSTNQVSTTTEPLHKAAEVWRSAKPETKLLLIEDYFAQLQDLCSEEEQRLLSSLHRALLSTIELIEKQLQENSHYLSKEIQKWSQTHPNTTLLLVVDQFEELITMSQGSLTTSDSKRLPFLEVLQEAIMACPQQWRIVVTLRSDFEPRFLDSPLRGYWQTARFPVPAMTSDELRQAIEGPAVKQALYFEPENLVGTLIDEVGQMPGALPLLSFTLSELYVKLYERWTKDQSTDRALRMQDYQALGGVAGSLTRRATDEYDKLVKDEDFSDEYRGGFGKEQGVAYQTIMQRVMLRMVTIEGGGVARRRVPESELVYASDEENQRVKVVVDRLVKARLLVKGQETGEPFVEPAHDFLVRGWDKLQEWIKEEQGSLTLQRELTPIAEKWFDEKVNNQSIGLLWNDDPRLPLTRKIYNSENNWFNLVETNFINSSIQRRLHIRRRTASILTGVITSLSGLTIFAFTQLQLSVLREKAARIENLLSTNPLEGQVLAIEATGQNHFWLPWNMISPLQSSLLSALKEAKEYNRFLIEGQDDIRSAAFSPDGKYIATGNGLTPIGAPGVQKINGTIWLRDLEGRPVGKPIQADQGGIDFIAFSQDSKYIATFGRNNVKVWDLQGTLIKEIDRSSLNLHGSNFTTYELILINNQKILLSQDPYNIDYLQASSQDGKYIVRVEDQNKNLIKIWNITDQEDISEREPLMAFRGYEGSILAVNFSQDGRYVIGVCSDSNIRVWEIQDNSVVTLNAQTPIKSITFSPDSQSVIAGGADGEDGTVRVWNLGSLKERSFESSGAYVNSVTMSSNDRYIASGGSALELWNTDGNLEKLLKGHTHFIESVAFISDEQIVSGSFDKTVRFWNLKEEKTKVIELTKKPFTFAEEDVWSVKLISINENKKYIAVGISTEEYDFTGTVQLLDMEGDPKGQPFGTNWRFALQPDGEYIAIGDGDIIQLWNTKGKPEGSPFRGHENRIESLAFSPDSRFIASGGWDETVRLWDLEGNLINTFLGHRGVISDITFSPDGRYIASGSQDGTIKLWPGNWKTILQVACNRLKHHPVLTEPKTTEAEYAARTCLKYAKDSY